MKERLEACAIGFYRVLSHVNALLRAGPEITQTSKGLFPLLENYRELVWNNVD